MSKAGAEIIAALEDAAAGKFARVTIRGQAWIPETPLHRAAPELLEALKQAVATADRTLELYQDGRSEECQADYDKAVAAIAKAENR